MYPWTSRPSELRVVASLGLAEPFLCRSGAGQLVGTEKPTQYFGVAPSALVAGSCRFRESHDGWTAAASRALLLTLLRRCENRRVSNMAPRPSACMSCLDLIGETFEVADIAVFWFHGNRDGLRSPGTRLNPRVYLILPPTNRQLRELNGRGKALLHQSIDGGLG
jgi:hypothetical protein